MIAGAAPLEEPEREPPQPAEPLAEPESAPEPPLSFEPAAETVGPEELQTADQPQAEEFQNDLVMEEPSEDAIQAIAEDLAGQRDELARLNALARREGSPHVADRIKDAQVKLKAKKWLTTTRGLEEGVIRSITATGAPKSAADEVFARYGIRVGMKYLDGSEGGYGFLNQASTDAGVYVNRPGRGPQLVFSYGSTAVAKMLQLEREALRARGQDPARARVIEVEFGIVKSRAGYDLGVRDISFAPVDFND
jgi:hypothetical protein